jgi:hypothetical protein
MKLKESNSGSQQDIEAAKVCNIKNGFYLDIGSFLPKQWSDTYSLEKELGWSGILIDFDTEAMDECRKDRDNEKNIFIIADLWKENITDILIKHNCPKHIDYISFDVDAANLQVIQDFDFNQFSFTFATFEHDAYKLGGYLKHTAQNIFLSNGYKLYREDIVADTLGPYEDWYIKN